MPSNARFTGFAPPTFAAFNLSCRSCSWRQQQIVTAEYANTLRIQHEFRYDKHTVDVRGEQC